MRLTLLTDYALRVLIHLAQHPGKVLSARQIAEAYGLPAGHFVKASKRLARLGWVASRRGAQGGIFLQRSPSEISVAAIVRAFEPTLEPLPGIAPGVDPQAAQARAEFVHTLSTAVEAMMQVLERTTVAEVARNGSITSWSVNAEAGEGSARLPI